MKSSKKTNIRLSIWKVNRGYGFELLLRLTPTAPLVTFNNQLNYIVQYSSVG